MWQGLFSICHITKFSFIPFLPLTDFLARCTVNLSRTPTKLQPVKVTRNSGNIHHVFLVVVGLNLTRIGDVCRVSSECFRFRHHLSIRVALINSDPNAVLRTQVINQKAFKATFGQLRFDRWTHVGWTHLLNYTDKTLWKSPFDIYFRHCQYMFSGIIHDL